MMSPVQIQSEVNLKGGHEGDTILSKQTKPDLEFYLAGQQGHTGDSTAVDMLTLRSPNCLSLPVGRLCFFLSHSYSRP